MIISEEKQDGADETQEERFHAKVVDHYYYYQQATGTPGNILTVKNKDRT